MDNNLENQTAYEKKPSNKKTKAIKIGVIIFIFLVILAVVVSFTLIVAFKNKTNIDKSKDNLLASTEVEKSKYWIENNSLQAFDLSFMQLEKTGNKVYSPLLYSEDTTAKPIDYDEE